MGGLVWVIVCVEGAGRCGKRERDELANSACNRGPNSSSSSWDMASRTSFGIIVFLLALKAFSFAL